MEEQAYEYFAKIDELGGMVEAVKRGFPQREIADAAFELQMEIDSGRRIVVGVNRFTEGDEQADRDPAHRSRARAQADRPRAGRSAPSATRPRVERVPGRDQGSAGAGEQNLMPLLIDAGPAAVSEGEIVEALQEVWGDYREQPVF